jgi:hypothetical protein
LRALGYTLSLLAVVLAVAPYSFSSVFASPCSVQLGFPVLPAANTNQPFTAVVPVSATCSKAYGEQLYATASAYDLNTDTSASTVTTILTSVDGGYTFTGQLGFSLPPSTQGHWVQIAVTIYQSQSGGPLSTAGEAFPVTTESGQVVTATVTQGSYEFASGTNQQPPSILAYVAIVAILATVIIVTVALVVYSKRPTGYYQAPRTY